MNAPLHVRSYAVRSAALLLAREEPSSYRAGEPPPVEPETASDWAEVHDRIVTLGGDRARHERDLCRWLLAAERLGVHKRAGHASLREYADRVVGLSERQTNERLRVGRALVTLPRLDAALASGALPWSAVRELTRVGTAATEEEWIVWAKGRRMRQIETAVATRRAGDRPTDRADPELRQHTLRFEVRAETLALFRDLQSAVRADLGTHVDDDTLLYEIARRALGGPTDEGRASYQIAVSRCPDCARASIEAAGESHPIPEHVADMASCDAQLLPPAAPTHVGPSSPTHVGSSHPRARASQTIPPATRREVLRRHRKRCAVPGCTHHQYLDVHHIHPRAEGGTHDPERLLPLCGAHHRAHHQGALQITGDASHGFRFRHADGSPYGEPVRPAAIEVAQHVLALLESLGFKPTQARALVDAVQRAGPPSDAEAFLRAALQAS
jgi:Holliday junction resolvase RuvA-like protein